MLVSPQWGAVDPREVALLDTPFALTIALLAIAWRAAEQDHILTAFPEAR